jgi:hypothetical protein
MQRKHNTHFAHQDIDRTAYYTPCDRIGRFYTPSAAGLTMKRATKIAKALALAPSQNLLNVLDYSLVATAPDAFEASAIIQHRVTQMADLKASGHGTNSKLNPIKKSKDLPIHTSKTALCDAHRLQRSQPMYTILPPVRRGDREQQRQQTQNMEGTLTSPPRPVPAHKNLEFNPLQSGPDP